MLSIDEKFPEFNLKAILNGKTIDISSEDLMGNWSIVFFYPEDFSFICPTEVSEFEHYRKELEERDTNLLGISVDDIKTHQKWADDLNIKYALGSDNERQLSKKVGVLDESDGRAHRATFILNPELKVQFVIVTSRNVGRSVKETMRVYRAIQTGKKCPADYQPTVGES